MSEVLAEKDVGGKGNTPEKSDVKLQVICAGLPRTGTTSLAAALEILGFGPVLHDHGGKVLQFGRLVDAKINQLKGKKNFIGTTSTKSKKDKEKDAFVEAAKDLSRLEAESGVSLSELTSGYGAVLDSPVMDFYPELLHLNPSAVVVLSVRDSDSAWWKSYYSTIGLVVSPSFLGKLLRLFVWPVREDTHVLGEKVTRLWEARYGKWEEEIHGKHAKAVESVVKGLGGDEEKRLLVWNVKEGWPKLCQFLGVEIPDEPFPRLNDTKEMKAFVGKRYPQAALFWLSCLLAIIGWIFFLIINSDGPPFEDLSSLPSDMMDLTVDWWGRVAGYMMSR